MGEKFIAMSGLSKSIGGGGRPCRRKRMDEGRPWRKTTRRRPWRKKKHGGRKRI